MLVALFVLGWLTCSVCAYLLMHTVIKTVAGEWRDVDRIIGITLSLSGPILLIIALPLSIVAYLSRFDGPASW